MKSPTPTVAAETAAAHVSGPDFLLLHDPASRGRHVFGKLAGNSMAINDL